MHDFKSLFFRAKINKMNIIVIFFYKSYVQHFTNEFDIIKSSPNSLKMALKCIRNFDLHFTQYMRICRAPAPLDKELASSTIIEIRTHDLILHALFHRAMPWGRDKTGWSHQRYLEETDHRCLTLYTFLLIKSSPVLQLFLLKYRGNFII